ncbi:MAG: ABC transporter permease [Acidobacteria bacterium]|nr:ABC transporter permease [Acidobacteriota bacterium]
MLIQDLRYNFRVLRKTPGFTAVIILTLALGIGATTAIFSVLNVILLRPLPYDNPDHLVVVWGTQPQLDKAPFSPADFLDVKRRNQVFERIAAYQAQNFNLTGSSDAMRLRGAMLSPEIMPLLGIKMAVGRGFLPEEDRPGNNQVVIVAHGLWQRSFGSDPRLVGQSLKLNGKDYTVVGILPADSQFLGWAELWVPLAFSDQQATVRDTRSLNVMARLKPGISLEQAQAEMTSIGNQLQQEYPSSNSGNGVRLVPLREQIVGDIRPVLFVLLGVVVGVLLIACANVANLLLSKAAMRQKEIGIRIALGASRWQVIRQLLTESALLALAGGLLGLLIAYGGIKLLSAFGPTNIPRLKEIGVDGRVLVVTLLLSLLTSVVFGLVPALQASRPDLNESLKEGGRGSSGGGIYNQRHRMLLVIAEVALALVLLIGAGLMVRSFLSIQRINPGFDPQNVLSMRIALPASKYPEIGQRAVFFQQVLERVRNLPSVISVGAITDLPLSGPGSSTTFSIRELPSNDRNPLTEYRVITPDYLRTMNIPLLRGRYFNEMDQEKHQRVVIINETLARRFFPNQDPLGKHLALSGPPDEREIVGVASDVKDYGLDAEVRPEVYIPYSQSNQPYSQYSALTLVLRTAADPQSLTGLVRGEVRSIDKDQPIYNIKLMQDVLSESVAPRLFNMFLISIFAVVALILAAVGIYGVIAYSVAQRTHEIGIRMALGAQPGDVLKLVVGQGMTQALIGILIGLVAAFALTRVMSSLLYEISPLDPITFAGLSIMLMIVAVIACYIPARRATRINPIIALRDE